MKSFVRNSIAALSLFTFCAIASAATAVPYTFTSGTAAKSTEVNANFQALATAINTLSTRVDALDGTTQITDADLVGTYTFTAFFTQVFKGVQNQGGGGTSGITYDSVATGSVTETITINAGGTGTAVYNSVTYSEIDMPEIDITNTNTTTWVASALTKNGSLTLPSSSFTWSRSGNTLTSSDGATGRFLAGTKAAVFTRDDPVNFMHAVGVLTRN